MRPIVVGTFCNEGKQSAKVICNWNAEVFFLKLFPLYGIYKTYWSEHNTYTYISNYTKNGMKVSNNQKQQLVKHKRCFHTYCIICHQRNCQLEWNLQRHNKLIDKTKDTKHWRENPRAMAAIVHTKHVQINWWAGPSKTVGSTEHSK